LIGKELKTDNETIAIAMQQHGKHASTMIVSLGNGVFNSAHAKGL
jgi:hypothetical protein